MTTISRDAAPRHRVLRFAVVTAAVSAVVLNVAGTAAAAPSPTAPGGGAHVTSSGDPSATGDAGARAQLSSRERGTIHYAVPKRVCPKPAPGELSCMALRLVDVPKGTKGAKSYVAPAYATGPTGGFTPADLASAYGYTPSSSVGATQTVAIVDAYDDPHALSDLNAFNAHYGLPPETSTSFRKVNQNGAASPLPAANAGWAGEIALDLEAVRAVCNRCKILLVEANSASGANLATAVTTAAAMHATEISNSYGGPENSSDNSASIAAAYDHPGIVITASTGDHGWYDWDYANEGSSGASDNASNTPASYPTVVAVGGTALALNADGTRQEEDVWNENGPDDQYGLDPWFGWSGAQGASGGGCSARYQAKAFQAGAAGYADTGCGSTRLAGDVAALADPYTGFDVYATYGGSGWATTGGTSLSAPLIAAMWALAGGSGGVAYPAQSLYDHLKYAPSSLYDVTLGGNAFCAGDSAASCSAALQAETEPPTGNPNNLVNGNSFYSSPWPGWAGLLDCGYARDGSETTIAANTQCNAATGYDGPSGVGTPQGLAAFKPMRPAIKMTAPALLKVNTAASFTATSFSDPIPGSTPASYQWNWGDGQTSVTASATVSHTYLAKGTYSIKLTVVDSNGRASLPVAKQYTLGYAPTAAITGATTVRVNTTHTWYAKTTEKNTGGKIVKWSWKVNSTVVGSASSLVRKFTARGSYKLTLTVTNNSGLRSSKVISVSVVS
jgi:subtilase family serine protease